MVCSSMLQSPWLNQEDNDQKPGDRHSIPHIYTKVQYAWYIFFSCFLNPSKKKIKNLKININPFLIEQEFFSTPS